jgi:hypothetical protein
MFPPPGFVLSRFLAVSLHEELKNTIMKHEEQKVPSIGGLAAH